MFCEYWMKFQDITGGHYIYGSLPPQALALASNPPHLEAVLGPTSPDNADECEVPDARSALALGLPGVSALEAAPALAIETPAVAPGKPRDAIKQGNSGDRSLSFRHRCAQPRSPHILARTGL